MAYVLLETLRRTALAGTELATAKAGTIRLRLPPFDAAQGEIGAVVRRSVRQIVLHLSESFPLRELFGSLVVRLSGRAGGPHQRLTPEDRWTNTTRDRRGAQAHAARKSELATGAGTESSTCVAPSTPMKYAG